VEKPQAKIEPMLEEVIRRNASDLHLQVGLPPNIRVDGALKPITDAPALTGQDMEQIVFSILDDEQKEILLKDKELDFSFSFGDYGRFRANIFHERGNIAAALRLIPNQIRTLTDLDMPPAVQAFTKLPRGLILVTGPTGSGKSTTLAAMVDKINSERACHILTIEDPIEYAHTSKKSMVQQREIHYDTYSFGAALRSSLREDPDVVLIGEMRDLETISAAITIAETGHLVLATLHTNSAAQSIDRMIDVFPPHQQQQVRIQLAGMLQGVVAQRLVPAIGGGRIAATEILVVTGAVRNIIREGKTHQIEAVIQTGAEQGMQSMDRVLVQLVQQGKITYDTAKEYAVDLEELDRLMRG
jgi:twitching motility protein PilT